jgi:hypothetical protein
LCEQRPDGQAQLAVFLFGCEDRLLAVGGPPARRLYPGPFECDLSSGWKQDDALFSSCARVNAGFLETGASQSGVVHGTNLRPIRENSKYRLNLMTVGGNAIDCTALGCESLRRRLENKRGFDERFVVRICQARRYFEGSPC